MVKFVGGPSVNAYKSYKNHTTAREGQWRMPRAYGSVKKDVKINIREYNNCGGTQGYYYGGFQLPAWLQWAQAGMGLLGQFLPQFTPEVEQPETNPFAQELEDLKKELEEVKAENEELKNNGKVTVSSNQATGAANQTTNSNSNFNQVTDFGTDETTNTQKTDDVVTTTEVAAQRAIKSTKAGYQLKAPLWDTLAMSYTYTDENGKIHKAANNEAFRAAIKQATGLTGNIYKISEINHFPNKITINGKEYSFSSATYLDTNNWVDYNTGGTVKEGNTNKGVVPGQTTTTTTTTHKGSTRVTVSGKTIPFTSTGKSSKQEVIEDLKNQINNSDLSPEDKKKAIAGITTSKTD